MILEAQSTLIRAFRNEDTSYIFIPVLTTLPPATPMVFLSRPNLWPLDRTTYLGQRCSPTKPVVHGSDDYFYLFLLLIFEEFSLIKQGQTWLC